MNTDTGPHIDDLRAIVEQIWSAYLDPEGLNPLRPVESAFLASEVYASVSITGSWPGQVVLRCSATLARHLAAAFLAVDVEDVGSDDIPDVLGELANIVGGNVKGLLPPGCAIATPHVVSGPTMGTHPPAAVRVCELVGVWMDELFSIGVWRSGNDNVEVSV